MKILKVSISESDFETFGFKAEDMSFEDLRSIVKYHLIAQENSSVSDVSVDYGNKEKKADELAIENRKKISNIKPHNMKPLTFEIERDGNEFHTWCPELPGCHTHGKTVKQAIENLKEAVQLYLEVLIEEEIAMKSIELAS